MSKIDFIGIGVQKAGTTWIHRALDAHPGIFVADDGEDKDTRFFSYFYDRGYQWYESHFGEAPENCLKGEVCTSYFYQTDVPARIQAYSPGVRLFVCLRNPVDRIISNHRHEVRLGHISGDNLDLMAALKSNPAYLLQSRYAAHLERWYRYFNRDQLLVLFFDDLKDRPDWFLHRLYGFLGVDAGFVPDDLSSKANASRVPASRGVEGSMRAVGKGLRKLGLGKLVAAGRNAGFNDWLRQANSVRDESAVVGIPDAALALIRDELRTDIARLASMTGRDLGIWLG